MTYHPISVTQLNNYIKEKFQEDEFLNNVLVKGEISNFKHHYTGHMYFTLKDENSLIKCVMFKTYTSNLNFVPKDGMKIMVLGTVSVFERDGVYQIYAKAMQQEGIGDLHAEYEKLKAKLEQEGLFDKAHKKPVIRDIINVSTRRNPNVYIRLFPVPVQGQGASEKIAKAIEIMNEKQEADVLIIARGGGSLEDLWPFNEEIVARAIYNSNIPIISAVGHETDFTIADFVSDLRAPTPSAAAELAVPDIKEIRLKIKTNENRLQNALQKKLELAKLRYEKCMKAAVYTNPLQRINENYMLLDKFTKTLVNSMELKIKEKKTYMVGWVSKLDALSPLKTLTRGYSITSKEDKIVKSVNELNSGDKVNLRFTDGKREAQIL